MRVLFDQGVPVPLRQMLLDYEIDTAYERDWATLGNGELLAVAEEAGYTVFVTTDKNLQYQQNSSERRIAILVLSTPSWPRIRDSKSNIVEAMDKATPGAFFEVSIR